MAEKVPPASARVYGGWPGELFNKLLKEQCEIICRYIETAAALLRAAFEFPGGQAGSRRLRDFPEKNPSAQTDADGRGNEDPPGYWRFSDRI